MNGQDDLRSRLAALEEEVREARASAEARARALDRFVHAVTHDLRAPIRTLDGFSSILLDDYAGALDDEGKDYARRIRQAALRLDQLVTDLHAYARISGAAIRWTIVDLDRLVPHVIADVDHGTVAPGTQIDVAGPLGTVRADEHLLRTAILQLLGNALKFTIPGTAARVRVSAAAGATPGLRRLRVDDEGIGVPEGQRERIFEVFERLHADSAYPGTGIGLALVRKVAERLGGAAGVEPAPGGGSRFWIDVPAP